MQELHNRGYIHGNIKPSNIVLGFQDDWNEINLIDFSMACLYKNVNGKHLTKNPPTKARATLDFASVRFL